jgi:hypothetical protein
MSLLSYGCELAQTDVRGPCDIWILPRAHLARNEYSSGEEELAQAEPYEKPYASSERERRRVYVLTAEERGLPSQGKPRSSAGLAAQGEVVQ